MSRSQPRRVREAALHPAARPYVVMRGVWMAALVTLAGCGWFSDDEGVFVNPDDDYLTAESGAPLRIPEDLDTERVGDPWPIPDIPPSERVVYFPDKAPRPDALYASDANQEVKIQRVQDETWLVLPEPTPMVWPKIKQFLADNGVAAAQERPRAGRIDTEWLLIGNTAYRDVIRLLLREARDEAGVTTGRDRLRLKVEQGIRPRTSEVHVRHENDSMAFPGAEETESFEGLRSDIPRAEAEMLSELGAYIAAKVSEQSISMLAQDIAVEEKAILARDGSGYPELRLRLDYERAWATVNQSFVNAAVEVQDVQDAAGEIRVAIKESQISGDRPGFFRRMLGEKEHDLLVRVSNGADSVHVSVYDDKQRRLDDNLSQQVLLLIREFAT